MLKPSVGSSSMSRSAPILEFLWTTLFSASLYASAGEAFTTEKDLDGFLQFLHTHIQVAQDGSIYFFPIWAR